MSIRSLIMASAGSSKAATGFWGQKFTDPSGYVNAQGGCVYLLASGEMYVIRFTNNINVNLLKLSVNGVILWERGLTGYGMSACVDASDSVFVTGYDPNQYNFVMKFNSAGTLQWNSGTSNISLGPGAIVAAPDGNIYIAGNFYNVAYITGARDAVMLKFSSTGVYQGRAHWRTTAGFEFVYGLAADASSNIYAQTTVDAQAGVIKFNPSLSPLASYRSNSASQNGGGVAIDSAGAIIFASSQHQVTKLNSAGTHLWTQEVHSGNERIVQVHVDAANAVYVTSNSQGQSVQKFDTNGNLIFAISLQFPGDPGRAHSGPSFKPVSTNATAFAVFLGFSNETGYSVIKQPLTPVYGTFGGLNITDTSGQIITPITPTIGALTYTLQNTVPISVIANDVVSTAGTTAQPIANII